MTTLQIQINGEQHTCNHGSTLLDVVAQHSQQDQSVAVAVNNDFVPRTQYAHTPINNGDAIDIVAPVGGG